MSATVTPPSSLVPQPANRSAHSSAEMYRTRFMAGILDTRDRDAPAPVVEEARARAAQLAERRQKLQATLAELGA